LRWLSEGNVSEAKPDLSRLAELASGIGLHEHCCLIYETEEEQLAAALPFLRSGLDRGEKCFFVADENSGAAVLNALRRAGTDVDRHLRSGALILADKPSLKAEHFDPDWSIGFLSKSIQGAGDDRFSGMRTWLGEMTWALAEETAPETLLEFEAKINHLVREHEVRALCQYRRQCFSPEVIMGILRTHPVVAYGGIVSENPYYVPPEELLKSCQAAREVERLLNNILKSQRSLDRLRALASRLNSAREEEGTRIAREIHDELGSSLTALKWEIEGLVPLVSSENPAVQKRLDAMMRLADSIIHGAKRIASELRPSILDDLGLLEAIESQAQEFQSRAGIASSFDSTLDSFTLNREQSVAVFRIVQEALTNILRHANATRVDIAADEQLGEFILTIRDNGKGITYEATSRLLSLGLLGMRERAHLIGGTIDIKGIEGKGTTVTLRMPVSRPAAP
jgi:signal transduction histidine kinase